MKNKLFLAACGLVIAGICAGSAYAANFKIDGTKKSYSYNSVANIKETYNYHFKGSGWNTPYYNLGACYRDQKDPEYSNSKDYNQGTFGVYYKFDAYECMKNSSKSFTARILGDGFDSKGNKLSDVAASKKASTTMTNSNDTTTINKNNSIQTLNWYEAQRDTYFCVFQCKKPLTATWSYDFEVTVWPFKDTK